MNPRLVLTAHARVKEEDIMFFWQENGAHLILDLWFYAVWGFKTHIQYIGMHLTVRTGAETALKKLLV